MDHKKQVAASSSSSSVSLDHLFGPKDPSSSSSSSSTGIFGSIFPPPSTVLGRKQDFPGQAGHGKYQTPDDVAGGLKGESRNRGRSSVYQNESTEPCYLSSSIYYGGQENYSPRTQAAESHQIFKKDGGDDDPNGSNSNSASRGNWWQGSLYY